MAVSSFTSKRLGINCICFQSHIAKYRRTSGCLEGSPGLGWLHLPLTIPAAPGRKRVLISGGKRMPRKVPLPAHVSRPAGRAAGTPSASPARLCWPVGTAWQGVQQRAASVSEHTMLGFSSPSHNTSKMSPHTVKWSQGGRFLPMWEAVKGPCFSHVPWRFWNLVENYVQGKLSTSFFKILDFCCIRFM